MRAKGYTEEELRESGLVSVSQKNGNIFDRFFRPEGVVDFIDVKFFGLFGMERFPTFNVADSFVMVCAILLVISVINNIVRDEKKKKAEEKK
jgi:signal peptidase II